MYVGMCVCVCVCACVLLVMRIAFFHKSTPVSSTSETDTSSLFHRLDMTLIKQNKILKSTSQPQGRTISFFFGGGGLQWG